MPANDKLAPITFDIQDHFTNRCKHINQFIGGKKKKEKRTMLDNRLPAITNNEIRHLRALKGTSIIPQNVKKT